MTNEIDQLKHDYRNIEAPAWIATRIRAEVADRPRKASWLTLAAPLAVAIAVIATVPMLLDDRDETVAPTSLTVLSLAASSTPSVAAPSLSNVQSPSLPALPAAPQPAQEPESDPIDTSFELPRKDSNELKEKDHAYS